MSGGPSGTHGGLTGWLDRRLYPDQRSNWDDQLFRERILEVLQKRDALLDLGAGAGILSQMDFLDHASTVYGLDPDPQILHNPRLHGACLGRAEALPFAAASFDLVFADNVLEHLETPEAVFREVASVLRNGGTFMVKTPNRWHYVPLIARLTPFFFHRLVNRLRGRRSEDTFPTWYRANTLRTLRHLADRSGLRVREIERIEGRPEYLRVCAATYVPGWLYERLVNAFRVLAPIRVLIIATFEKPADRAIPPGAKKTDTAPGVPKV